MPSFGDFVSKVVETLKAVGPLGLSITELTQIAEEMGWSHNTARRRSYYIKTLLKAIGVIEETHGAWDKGPMALIIPRLLSVLHQQEKINQTDLAVIAQNLASQVAIPHHTVYEWRKLIDDSIEILEGIGVLQRKDGLLILNVKKLEALRQTLSKSRIVI